MTNRTMQTTLSISLIYALFGVLWIFFSDCLLATLVSAPHQLITSQTDKGWIVVAVSVILIEPLLRRELMRNKKECP